MVSAPVQTDAPRPSTVTNILGWGGALALVLAATYLIRLTVDHGWLTPERQVVLAVVYLLVIAVAFSAIQVIFQTALYRYADRGEVPEGFDREALAGAIQHKPDRT